MFSVWFQGCWHDVQDMMFEVWILSMDSGMDSKPAGLMFGMMSIINSGDTGMMSEYGFRTATMMFIINSVTAGMMFRI